MLFGMRIFGKTNDKMQEKVHGSSQTETTVAQGVTYEEIRTHQQPAEYRAKAAGSRRRPRRVRRQEAKAVACEGQPGRLEETRRKISQSPELPTSKETVKTSARSQLSAPPVQSYDHQVDVLGNSCCACHHCGERKSARAQSCEHCGRPSFTLALNRRAGDANLGWCAPLLHFNLLVVESCRPSRL